MTEAVDHLLRLLAGADRPDAADSSGRGFPFISEEVSVEVGLHLRAAPPIVVDPVHAHLTGVRTTHGVVSALVADALVDRTSVSLTSFHEAVKAVHGLLAPVHTSIDEAVEVGNGESAVGLGSVVVVHDDSCAVCCCAVALA